MAGRARLNAVAAELAKRAVRELGDGATGFQYAEHWIGGGGTIAQLARDFSASLSLGDVSPDLVRRAIGPKDNETDAALTRARARGSHYIAEQALDIADSVSTDSREDIAKAKLQVEMRQWLAGKWNKQEYGDAARTNVTINLGDMHLDALRVPRQISNPLRATVVDAEVIEIQEVSAPLSIESGDGIPARIPDDANGGT